MSESKKKISAFSIIEIVVIAILIVLIIGMIGCNIMFRSDNSAASLFGYSFYKTKAVNMLPEIPVNTVIVAKKSEIENIHEGSVVLCNIGGHTTLTRVTAVQEEAGVQYYIVKFDTSPATETFRISSGDIIAKAMWQLEYLGKFLDFATSIPGIVVTAMIPLVVIVLFQVLRLRKINKLEQEASSMDGIEDFFAEQSKRTSAFDEDEDEDEDEAGGFEEAAVPKEAEVSDKMLRINEGKADYVPSPRVSKQDASRLFTYNRETGRVTEPEAAIGNQPTRIPAAKAQDDIFSLFSDMKGGTEKDVSVHISNIIPDKLAAVQEKASENTAADAFSSYFEKDEFDTGNLFSKKERVVNETPTIPENAVIPKETLAPAKKKSSSKTISELMSLIDAEESKLKK